MEEIPGTAGIEAEQEIMSKLQRGRISVVAATTLLVMLAGMATDEVYKKYPELLV